jgi:DNA repair exonuclease SbcCD nuclease subunit
VRFLHTSDWQLGLRRYYLDADAQARYAADRFEAVRRLGEVGKREGAELVVVAGDVFDSNRVDRRTLLRGFDAMAAVGLPLYLLPGNHDALDAGSVYRSAAFRENKPPSVHVLDGAAGVGEPGEGAAAADDAADGGAVVVEVRPGVELVGAPWRSKRPLEDLVARLAASLPPARGVVRVAVGHGEVDSLSPDADDPARISLAAAEAALAEGRFHFLALGDRHSVTRVAERVWYSGTPEPTDFNEERPGHALLVDVTADGCAVEEVEVGRWSFLRRDVELAGEADLDRLEADLAALPERSRTVLRLALSGALPLHAAARLDRLLTDSRERFAAVDVRRAAADLVLLPDSLDREELGLSGYVAAAFEELLAEAQGGGEDDGGEKDRGAEQPTTGGAEAGATADAAAVAQDALALLYRLARQAEGAAPPEGGDG